MVIIICLSFVSLTWKNCYHQPFFSVLYTKTENSKHDFINITIILLSILSRLCTKKMIRSIWLLFAGGLPLLVCMKEPTEQHAQALSKPLQSTVSECSAPHYLHDEGSSLCIATRPVISPLQTRISTPSRTADGFSKKENEALTKLLLAIVETELSQCVLAIMWDSGFSESVTVDRLSLLPNVKQVFMMYTN